MMMCRANKDNNDSIAIPDNGQPLVSGRDLE